MSRFGFAGGCRWLVLCSLVVVLGLVWAASASAATDTVSNLNDSGAGSLRAVVAGATAGDTIDFSVTGTITLQSPITISQSLTISGPGESQLTIDGGGTTRLFQMPPENGSAVHVSFSGLTLADASGGAINDSTGVLDFEDKNSLSVSGVTFSHDTGAAILCDDGGHFSVSDSTFSDDSGFTGGAIFDTPDFEGDGGFSPAVSDSIFTGDNAGGAGGAIFVLGAGLSVSGSTFTGNSSAVGGAIDVLAGSGLLSVSGSTFTGNSAGGAGGAGTDSGSGDGGAIFLLGGSTGVAVSDSTFAGNSAGGAGGAGTDSGAGIGGAIEDASPGSLSVITDSTFTANSAGGPAGSGSRSGSGDGGAIATFASSSLSDVTIDGNSIGPGAPDAASGIAGAVRVTAAGTIVSGNKGGPNCDAHVTSSSYNLEYGSGETESSCGFDQSQVPSADPRLGALQSNGGPTETQALAASSPAVDVVPQADCPAKTDQRGFPRPDAGEAFCDLGAYELQDAPTVLRAAPQLVLIPFGGVGLGRVSATLTSSGQPLAGHTISFTSGTTGLCSATTGANGTASCALGPLAELSVLISNSYTASFAGDGGYLPSSATTPAIELGAVGSAASAGRTKIGIVRAVLSGAGVRYLLITRHRETRAALGRLRRLEAGRYTLTVTLTDGRVLRRALTLR
jgi:hypothetical protein